MTTRAFRGRAMAARLCYAFVIATCAFAAPAQVRAQSVVWVQSYGTDAAGCGARAAPCRSITQALAAASPGAIVRVGPGRYGDLNRNGLHDAGDEGPPTDPPVTPGINDGQKILIRVAKAVQIESTHGAEVTTIDPGVHSLPEFSRIAVFGVVASDVTIGTPGHGFRLAFSGPTSNRGVSLYGGAPVENVWIAGNTVDGTRLSGGDTFAGIEIRGDQREITVSNNVLSGAEWGVLAALDLERVSVGGPVAVVNNTFRDNAYGLGAYGDRITASSNVFRRNFVGMVIANPLEDEPTALARPLVSGNWIVASRLWGIQAASTGTVIRNALIGNVEAGVIHTGGTLARFELNNLYGNGAIQAWGLPQNEPEFSDNCAILVDTRYTEQSASIVASNNYWGAASGPGPDPADYSSAADSPCRRFEPYVVDRPFATQPFVIPVVPTTGAPRG